jgi:transcriptional regulator with XRE-family HTH domain
MQSTVKQRLLEFIKHKNLSVQKFEKMVGVANGYVRNIRKSITQDKLEQIALTFPDLNQAWLLLGEGDMLNCSPPPSISPGEEQAEEKNNDLLSAISQQSESISAILQQQNRILRQLDLTLSLLASMVHNLSAISSVSHSSTYPTSLSEDDSTPIYHPKDGTIPESTEPPTGEPQKDGEPPAI